MARIATCSAGSSRRSTIQRRRSCASRVSSTRRPPDIVVVDRTAGVHVVEVKGITVDQIEDVEPGGEIRVRYRDGLSSKNFIKQVRAAMFDIRDFVRRECDGEPEINFEYVVVFPAIRREDWRWSFNSPEFVFQDECETLAARMLSCGSERRSVYRCDAWRSEEIDHVRRAFGDNAVLCPLAELRPGRRTNEGTLGESFDECATSYKNLTPEQQELSEEEWEQGPRLVRGVAGSGKTIVLANNLARRIERLRRSGDALFASSRVKPRIGAVCFNRALVPFLREKVAQAFRQRMGAELDDAIELRIGHLNHFYWELSQRGVWPYRGLEQGKDRGLSKDAKHPVEQRARHYHEQLLKFKAAQPVAFDEIAFDTIYVDEGQDVTG